LKRGHGGPEKKKLTGDDTGSHMKLDRKGGGEVKAKRKSKRGRSREGHNSLATKKKRFWGVGKSAVCSKSKFWGQKGKRKVKGCI